MMIHWCIRELLRCSVTRDLFLDIRNARLVINYIDFTLLFAMIRRLKMNLFFFIVSSTIVMMLVPCGHSEIIIFISLDKIPVFISL
jgi:hypothetical protein